MGYCENPLAKLIKENNRVKKVSKQDFAKVKHLSELGLTVDQTAKIAKLSPATISRIRGQRTWADYLTYKKEYRNMRAKQIVDNQADLIFGKPVFGDQVPSIEDVRKMVSNSEKAMSKAGIYNNATFTEKHLDRIATSLESIVKALDKEPAKKRWL